MLLRTEQLKKSKKGAEEMIFRKLTANDVEARVQSCDENGFVLLLYKNARCDMNILDETVGAENWQREHYECKGNLFCRVGIDTTSGWVWKADCGTESNTEKEKGESSDSFKRACFNWGIGRELYTAPKTKIKGHTKLVKRNGKDVYVPEYYTYDVVKMEVSDDIPRKITALTIVGKSMEDGYHEDVIFDWTDKSNNAAKTPTKAEPKAEPKATPKQVEILKKHYTGNNLTKLLETNSITAIEDISLAKASEIIGKLKKKAEEKSNGQVNQN